MKLIQLIISVLILLCVVAEVAAHAGSIAGPGWLLAAVFVILSCNLVRISAKELRQSLEE